MKLLFFLFTLYFSTSVPLGWVRAGENLGRPPLGGPVDLSSTVAAETAEQLMASELGVYVAEQLAVDVSEIEIEGLTPMNGHKSFLPGKILNIRPASRNHFLGRAVFIVTLQENNGGPFEQWVSADVARIQNVLVMERTLQRLSVIEEGDIRLQSLHVRRHRSRYVSDPEGVVGKRLTQSLRKGVPIRSDQVEIAPLVQRGERVTLTLQSGALQIITSAEAKEDGHLGETIKVLNLDSKKTVFAEVAGAANVRIVLHTGE